ncbi:hypothetical protein CEXT_49951 [Caerostris extrusa]|uniref:Uncharacterized protein n=1 Tax=Caerostris extrusa TaxID=172846 RepID=A0AAV4QQ50_CAEEX|nr:hypothetical protein CEXT_49951 [Caerostris extrusa]
MFSLKWPGDLSPTVQSQCSNFRNQFSEDVAWRTNKAIQHPIPIVIACAITSVICWPCSLIEKYRWHQRPLSASWWHGHKPRLTTQKKDFGHSYWRLLPFRPSLDTRCSPIGHREWNAFIEQCSIHNCISSSTSPIVMHLPELEFDE